LDPYQFVFLTLSIHNWKSFQATRRWFGAKKSLCSSQRLSLSRILVNHGWWWRWEKEVLATNKISFMLLGKCLISNKRKKCNITLKIAHILRVNWLSNRIV
jgi:hypothetical protein